MTALGPMFSFECTRITRRQRVTFGRCVYVALLLVMLGLIYLSYLPRSPESFWDFLFGAQMTHEKLAQFGLTFFIAMTFVQYFVGALAMAGSSAAILAEEKERNTLPFLLTTTLHDREIVLGKLTARMLHVMMLLFAGLPVLAIMQVMGGIDPTLLSYSFVAIAATILSAAGIGAWASVQAESVKGATSMAVGAVAIYHLILPYGSIILQRFFGTIPIMPTPWGMMSLAALIDYLNSGSLMWATFRMSGAFGAPGALSYILLPALLQFVAFHLLIAAAFGGWSAFRLRKILAKQSENIGASKAKTSKKSKRGKARHVSETRPIWWRETATTVAKPKQRSWHRWMRKGIFVLSFYPICAIIYEELTYSGNLVGREVHEFIRGMGTLVICITLLHVAMNAAGMIGRERRKKTLDELSLTQLTNREILGQKLMAAIWSARWATIWLSIHWTIDYLVGGMHPLTLFVVPPMLAVYVVTVACTGLFCSVYETAKTKAGALSLLLLILMAMWPWLLPLGQALLVGSGEERIAYFAAGVCPPSAIGFCTIGTRDIDGGVWRKFQQRDIQTLACGVIVGLSLYSGLAVLFWRKSMKRFAVNRPE